MLIGKDPYTYSGLSVMGLIFIPDLKRGYLIEVKPPLARFQVFGSTHISITNLDNLQLSFQAAWSGHSVWADSIIGRNKLIRTRYILVGEPMGLK